MGADLAVLGRGLAWQVGRYLSFTGTSHDMPESRIILIALALLSVLGALAEQASRGNGIIYSLVVPAVWVTFVWIHARQDSTPNSRLASALFLISLPVEAAIVLTQWIPGMEWPIAVWGALAMATVSVRSRENCRG